MLGNIPGLSRLFKRKNPIKAEDKTTAMLTSSVAMPPKPPAKLPLEEIYDTLMPTGLMKMTLLTGASAEGAAYFAYVAFDQELESEVMRLLSTEGRIHPFAMVVEQGEGYPPQQVQAHMQQMYDFVTPQKG